MKIHHLFILVMVCVALTRCKNEHVNPAAATPAAARLLLGKWSLVKDSTSSSFIGPAVNITEYTGTADDYYDFKADGKVYIKENGVYSTMAYTMATDTSAFLGDVNFPSVINPLTSHSATINFAMPQGPGGGHSSHTVYLSK